ncbi:hypothetical protein NV379_18965 [Paenibacillus sp. N1-5-1-14]|uniref:hypothetical protein n=1 Tax=Paenibacillus radicibacter TaxID=2972488 RepID=UPI002158D570|nr:hypothetical protein [Paenibacillus radicibacter]MCR8644740.1 hypothetical protein [Paenibacillus radicibacter]
MANKPVQNLKFAGRRIKVSRTHKTSSKLLSRFTIVWCDRNGVTFDTSAGFFAQLTFNGRVVAEASFDNFGVCIFPTITTLTRVRYRLRIFNFSGLLFRTRTTPAGVEAFVVIG